MSEPIKLPRTIDDPPEILLWSSDEMIPMLFCVCVGIFINHFFIMTFIGVILWRALRRYKNSRPNGFLMHILYWFGMPLGKSPILANSFLRHWHG